MPINEETRADIDEVFAEIHVTLRMAKAGVTTVEAETSERDTKYAVDAVGRHLEEVRRLTKELEGYVAEVLLVAEAPEKVEAPQVGAGRTGRSARGRRGE